MPHGKKSFFQPLSPDSSQPSKELPPVHPTPPPISPVCHSHKALWELLGQGYSRVLHSSWDAVFLFLQHNQDSCLGICLMFLNFLLSGQCKNSFGLLLPHFIDCFSSLWFYCSTSLHLLLCPAVPSSRGLGLQQTHRQELPATQWELPHCLPPGFSSKCGFAKKPANPLAAARLRRVVTAAICAD